MKILKLLYILFAALVITSCVSLNTSKQMKISPQYQLLLKPSEMEFLGEMKGEIKYSRYLGFITTNNHAYLTLQGQDTVYVPVQENLIYSTPTNFINLKGLNRIVSDARYINRLMYQLQMKYPDADIIIPIYIIREKNVMFLGSKNTIKVKAKAYKFK